MSLDPARKQEITDVDAGCSAGEHAILPEIVRGIVDTMSAANISEIEIEHRDLRLVIKASPTGPASETAEANLDVHLQSVEAADEVATHLVTAPMIGTFYAAPAPGKPPFVQVGQYVEAGQSIGIIEAMKIMNEIAPDQSGEVIEILVENGQTVEYGSPLVRLRIDS